MKKPKDTSQASDGNASDYSEDSDISIELPIIDESKFKVKGNLQLTDTKGKRVQVPTDKQTEKDAAEEFDEIEYDSDKECTVEDINRMFYKIQKKLTKKIKDGEIPDIKPLKELLGLQLKTGLRVAAPIRRPPEKYPDFSQPFAVLPLDLQRYVLLYYLIDHWYPDRVNQHKIGYYKVFRILRRDDVAPAWQAINRADRWNLDLTNPFRRVESWTARNTPRSDFIVKRTATTPYYDPLVPSSKITFNLLRALFGRGPTLAVCPFCDVTDGDESDHAHIRFWTITKFFLMGEYRTAKAEVLWDMQSPELKKMLYDFELAIWNWVEDIRANEGHEAANWFSDTISLSNAARCGRNTVRRWIWQACNFRDEEYEDVDQQLERNRNLILRDWNNYLQSNPTIQGVKWLDGNRTRSRRQIRQAERWQKPSLHRNTLQDIVHCQLVDSLGPGQTLDDAYFQSKLAISNENPGSCYHNKKQFHQCFSNFT